MTTTDSGASMWRSSMRRKSISGSRSQVIIDVSIELDTTLKRAWGDSMGPRGRTSAVALCAPGGVGRSDRFAQQAD